jgi:hypothetical protein
MAAQAEKAYYQFNKGINTEGSLIAFPEGFSADEENYDLFTDGSRRRRRGLGLEAGGNNKEVAAVIETNITGISDGLVGSNPRRTITTDEAHNVEVGFRVTIQEVVGTGTYNINGTWDVLEVPDPTTFRIAGSGDPSGSYTSGGKVLVGGLSSKACRSHKWESVLGDSSRNFKIVQLGIDLYVYEDVGTVLSQNLRPSTINLYGFKVPTATQDDVTSDFVDISYGRGDAFVTGKYITPFYIRYDADLDIFLTVQLNIKERDFEGIDDGIPLTAFPDTLSGPHQYNLLNRGWTETYISDYFTTHGAYPSKAMIAYLGLKRTLTSSNNYDLDGVRTFSPEKLIAELFQDASAPQGHFVRDPFSPATVPSGSAGDPVLILGYGIPALTAGPQTVTVNTTTAHGLSPGDSVNIVGNKSVVDVYLPRYGTVQKDFSIDGLYSVVAAPDADTFTITKVMDDSYHFALLGTLTAVNAGAVYVSVVGAAANSPYRPTCSAFYAGRVWYAGTPFRQLASRLFFTQIIESDSQYEKCYQVADPTDERISDVLPSDGGVVVIPEMGTVLKLLPFSSALLIFATAGIWAVLGNSGDVFTATGYSIKKLSESGCVSGTSVVLANGIPYYAGASDIFRIVQDPDTRQLVTENVTERTVHTLYTQLLDKTAIQGEYDDVGHRLVWLCKSNSLTPELAYDKALLFHTTLGAFTKYSFPYNPEGYVVSLTALRDATLPTRKLKFITLTISGTLLTIAETNQDTFLDFGLAEQPAYMVSGPETLGDAARLRYAPYIWVFSKKTETGYSLLGLDDYVPVGESSTKIQARFDWADTSSAGKWGQIQEVYRRSRLYQPTSAADTFADGQPMVVTRTRIRGKGHSVQIKLYAGTGKDSWIAGWHARYDVHTEK